MIEDIDKFICALDINKYNSQLMTVISSKKNEYPKDNDILLPEEYLKEPDGYSMFALLLPNVSTDPKREADLHVTNLLVELERIMAVYDYVFYDQMPMFDIFYDNSEHCIRIELKFEMVGGINQ
tara:strand:- start:1040 stop:1411 length:372 start_codon:yes stop_codon:yes gene_type:complete